MKPWGGGRGTAAAAAAAADQILLQSLQRRGYLQQAGRGAQCRAEVVQFTCSATGVLLPGGPLNLLPQCSADSTITRLLILLQLQALCGVVVGLMITQCCGAAVHPARPQSGSSSSSSSSGPPAWLVGSQVAIE